MRILWLTPGFAADEQDYNCIPPLQLLAMELLRQGVDLQIVALEYPFRSEPYHWGISPFMERSGEASVFPCNGQNRRWLKPRTLWRATATFRKLTTFGKFDAIHSFWLGWASSVGEKMARRRGVRHFTTLMGQDVLPENRRFLRGMTAERAARLVAVSNFQNNVFEKNAGLRTAHIIPWGLAEAEIPAELPAERSLDVLGVGSLVRVKNWGKWLRAIALAAQRFPNLRAELIGEGPERAKLEQLAGQLGLTGKMRFAGSLPRPEVLARMRQAKVLLHTSDFESFGYVLAEAATSGCWVVSTPVGVAAELGAVAEKEEDLAALVAQGLRRQISHQPLTPFLMKKTAQAYLQLYEDE